MTRKEVPNVRPHLWFDGLRISLGPSLGIVRLDGLGNLRRKEEVMYELVLLDVKADRRFSVFFDTPKERKAWAIKHRIGYSKKLIKVAQWNH